MTTKTIETRKEVSEAIDTIRSWTDQRLFRKWISGATAWSNRQRNSDGGYDTVANHYTWEPFEQVQSRACSVLGAQPHQEVMPVVVRAVLGVLRDSRASTKTAMMIADIEAAANRLGINA